MAGDGLVTRGTAKVSWGESGATCSVPGRTATWLTQSGRRLMPTARGGTHSPSPPRLGEAVRRRERGRSRCAASTRAPVAARLPAGTAGSSGIGPRPQGPVSHTHPFPAPLGLLTLPRPLPVLGCPRLAVKAPAEAAGLLLATGDPPASRDAHSLARTQRGSGRRGRDRRGGSGLRRCPQGHSSRSAHGLLQEPRWESHTRAGGLCATHG